MKFLDLRSRLVAGFSLIEMSITLILVGILLSFATMKASQLLEMARIQKLTSQLRKYQMAVDFYREAHNEVPPGLFPLAEGDSSYSFWQALVKDKLITEVIVAGGNEFGQGLPASPLGGGFLINNGWLVLCNKDEAGLLTPAQAQAIQSKVQEFIETKVETGVKSAKECIKEGQLDLEETGKVCIMKFNLLN